MLGMRVTEERTFDMTFPSDWSVEIWQGQAAEVKLKCHEIFSWVLPKVEFRHSLERWNDGWKKSYSTHCPHVSYDDLFGNPFYECF